MVQIPGENSILFWSIRSGRVTKIHSPSSSLSNDERLKNIGHNMSIRNLIFRVNSAAVSYLIRYDNLLQNATDVITKCDTKCGTRLLQNTSGFDHKMRQLLQNATFVKNCDITRGFPC